GMKHLREQLAAAQQDDIVKASGLWMELSGLLGEKQLPKLFAEWDKAEIDAADPSPAVRATLLAESKDDAKLNDWWRRAALMIQKRPKSPLASTRPATMPALATPKELVL